MVGSASSPAGTKEWWLTGVLFRPWRDFEIVPMALAQPSRAGLLSREFPALCQDTATAQYIGGATRPTTTDGQTAPGVTRAAKVDQQTARVVQQSVHAVT